MQFSIPLSVRVKICLYSREYTASFHPFCIILRAEPQLQIFLCTSYEPSPSQEFVPSAISSSSLLIESHPKIVCRPSFNHSILLHNTLKDFRSQLLAPSRKYSYLLRLLRTTVHTLSSFQQF